MEHTPGKWAVLGRDIRHLPYAVPDNDPKSELLEALKALSVKFYHHVGYDAENIREYYHAKAVIAKTEGG